MSKGRSPTRGSIASAASRLADEGTLFLDEIANMPVRLQSKLLRVLQTGEVQRVGSSRLRYVNVRDALGYQRRPARRDCRRTVPRGSALSSEHRRDSPPAAARSPGRHRRARPSLSRRTTPRGTASRCAAFDDEALAAHATARVAGKRPRAGPHHRTRGAHGRSRGHAYRRTAPRTSASKRPAAAPAPDDLSLEDAERVFIEKVLARHQGDVRQAAQQLGMSRSALYRRLQQYGVRE